ncbi:hypothetical protein TSUD_185710 [Trifolium subterraneum]|uniref:60S ribosomal export protein NMD3 OB-fold domain-containing protein n=1 Tax=Trifolium subterraneum TaxID=3900 RepID=A0A2Z6MU48_TRISU|nr:hypothetical protein TSUD_185710 [Trifolium subterraneum]
MHQNTTDICLRCLCSEVDITEDLLRHLALVHCPECESYLQPPKTWDPSLLASRDLVEYIVLDLEVVSSKVGSSEDTMSGTEYVLADVHVARKSDFGMNDTMFSSRTHLGNLLKPGDHVLGYDLYMANRNDSEYDKHKGHIPEVILIKKIDEEKGRYKNRSNRSSWRSHSMEFNDVDAVGAFDDSLFLKLLNDFEISGELPSEEDIIEE